MTRLTAGSKSPFVEKSQHNTSNLQCCPQCVVLFTSCHHSYINMTGYLLHVYLIFVSGDFNADIDVLLMTKLFSKE